MQEQRTRSRNNHPHDVWAECILVRPKVLTRIDGECSFSCRKPDNHLDIDAATVELQWDSRLDVSAEDGVVSANTYPYSYGDETNCGRYASSDDDIWGCLSDHAIQIAPTCEDIAYGTQDAEPGNRPPSPKHKRSVRFGTVRIREYSISVGAYAACNDTCPLQLTWEYSPAERHVSVEDHQLYICCKRSPLHRLSIFERRARIAFVQGTTTENVRHLEYSMAIGLIHDTMQSVHAIEHAYDLRHSIRNARVKDEKVQQYLHRSLPPLPRPR